MVDGVYDTTLVEILAILQRMDQLLGSKLRIQRIVTKTKFMSSTVRIMKGYAQFLEDAMIERMMCT